METKDIFLLLLGGIFGGIFGLLLTLFIQPLLEDKARGVLIRVLGTWIRPKISLTGNWASVMVKSGNPLNRDNEITEIVLKEFRNRVSGTFKWKNRDYRLLGRRDSNQYLTGTYEDIRDGYTFQGAFQLRIYPNEDIMSGRWIGFNSSNEIIEGPWEWRRSEHKEYSFDKKEQVER